MVIDKMDSYSFWYYFCFNLGWMIALFIILQHINGMLTYLFSKGKSHAKFGLSLSWMVKLILLSGWILT